MIGLSELVIGIVGIRRTKGKARMATLDDVYRKYGEVSEAAQLLETQLGNLLLSHKCIEAGLLENPSPDIATAIYRRITKQTLGRLIQSLGTLTDPNVDLDDLLRGALATRNRLTHSFFLQHNFRRNSDAGRDVMLRDLELIHDILLAAYDAVLLVSGVDPEKLVAEHGDVAPPYRPCADPNIGGQHGLTIRQTYPAQVLRSPRQSGRSTRPRRPRRGRRVANELLVVRVAVVGTRREGTRCRSRDPDTHADHGGEFDMSRWKHGENPFGESIGAKFDLGNKRHLYGRITLSNERGSYASTTKIFDSITIFDDRRFDFPPGSNLHGVSEKGKVSLISCHRGDARFDSTTMSCTVKSQYAVFGNDHLPRHDPVIREVQFGFEDLHTVFDHHGGRDAFGLIVYPDHRIVEAINKYKPDYVPSIGEYKHPWVSYFSGKFDLLPTTQTVLGSVSAQRYLYSSTSSGISISDIPCITIEFGDEPVTLDDAVDKMNTVRRFFAWIIGYAPKFTNVRMFTGDKPSEGEYDPGFDVFMSNRGGTTGREKLGGSILVSASQPEYFMRVMENWLERNNERLQTNPHVLFSDARNVHHRHRRQNVCSSQCFRSTSRM